MSSENEPFGMILVGPHQLELTTEKRAQLIAELHERRNAIVDAYERLAITHDDYVSCGMTVDALRTSPNYDAQLSAVAEDWSEPWPLPTNLDKLVDDVFFFWNYSPTSVVCRLDPHNNKRQIIAVVNSAHDANIATAYETFRAAEMLGLLEDLGIS